MKAYQENVTIQYKIPRNSLMQTHVEVSAAEDVWIPGGKRRHLLFEI